MMKIIKKFYVLRVLGIVAALSFVSCDTLLDVDPPSNTIPAYSIYNDAEVIQTVVNGLYTRNLLSNYIYYEDLMYYLALIADEAYHTSTSFDDLRYNSYSPTNSQVLSLWTNLYASNLLSNDLIEQLSEVDESVLPKEEREQYIGEAKYFRAYNYFVLVYLWGDVPWVTSTNVLQTNYQSRESKEKIIAEGIIQDLKDAEIALVNSKNTNIKVTKAAAQALLARNYLYHKEWANAEAKADEVIRTSGYTLDKNLDDVFLRTSKESIFKISSSGSWSSYVDRVPFGYRSATASLFRLTDDLVASLGSDGDLRKEKWTVFVQDGEYYHPYKYKRSAASSAGAAEDFVLLRLTEQFLIRAEARAQQNKLEGENGAIADIDTVRIRAGLPKLSQNLTKEEVLLVIEKERRNEFFLEEAHRWWDLVRTGRADAVLGAFPGKKWESHKALLPIPESQFTKNPNLGEQNPGYGDIQ